MLERYLVDQCSPTLAGIKTGSLFSIQGEDPALIKREVQKINRIFYGKGLLLLPLKTTGGYSLLYLYRPCYLKRDLCDKRCASLLKEFGYTSSLPSRCLVHLIQRVRKEGAFPHEIGLFLGYPPEDVKGFIENPHCKSRCRSCVGGCWKVYHEPEKAQVLFRKYEQCTKNYRKRLIQGASLEQLAVTA
ncbi:MAG: DUF3793 family protein [Clostridiales bacterium]|nr:DUF3793 family protein [Clostridiales bacterium]